MSADLPWALLSRSEAESTPSRTFHGLPGIHCSQLYPTEGPSVTNATNMTSSALFKSGYPSPAVPIRPAAMSLEEETAIRFYYISLLFEAGPLLDLPLSPVLSAALFFHRFYSQCALQQEDPFLVLCACLLLASKIEEQSRSVRDVINVLYRTAYSQELALYFSSLFWDIRDAVLRYEQQLLRVLNYPSAPRHPQHFLLHFAREIECSEGLTNIAFYLCNDCFVSSLSLRYSAPTIACSALYLAAELIGETVNLRLANSSSSSGSYSLSLPPEWWEHFSCQRLEIEDCCHQILDLYEALELSGGVSSQLSAQLGNQGQVLSENGGTSGSSTPKLPKKYSASMFHAALAASPRSVGGTPLPSTPSAVSFGSALQFLTDSTKD